MLESWPRSLTSHRTCALRPPAGSAIWRVLSEAQCKHLCREAVHPFDIPNLGWFRAVVCKVWSPEREHQHHLGTCRISIQGKRIFRLVPYPFSLKLGGPGPSSLHYTRVSGGCGYRPKFENHWFRARVEVLFLFLRRRTCTTPQQRGLPPPRPRS